MTMANSFRRRGAVLIMFSLTIVVIFGFIGLAFDLGRVILSRNEAQSFCDSAALAGAVMLDGTTPDRALDAVNGIYMTASNTAWKRYEFQNTDFAGYTVKFSQTGVDGSFVTLARGANAAGFRFIEVIAPTTLPMYLAPVLTGNFTQDAGARAVAAQVRKTRWDEGLAPFAPKGHCSDTGLYGLQPCAGAPDARLQICDPDTVPNVANCPPQTVYTLRWQANNWSQSFKDYRPTIDDSSWCSGDRLQYDPACGGTCTAADAYNNAGGTLGYALAEWYKFGTTKWVDGTGFFTTGSVQGANDYRQLLEGSMGAPVDLNQMLPGFDGVEPQQVSAIKAELTDMAALGPPDSYVYVPLIDPINGTIVNFGMFELIPGAYGPNNNWCAVYRGKCTFGVCQGQVLQDGIYEIRLVR